MNPEGKSERSWILGSNKAVMIACGLKHILVVLEDGNLYTYGNNQYGQRAYYPSKILNYLSDIPEMNVVYITGDL
jgi:alpha-tubulin suppressor-like RCC1 family protein